MDFVSSAQATDRFPLLHNRGILPRTVPWPTANGQREQLLYRRFSGQSGSKVNASICHATACRLKDMATGAASIQAAFGSHIEESFVIWSKSMNFSIKTTIREFVAPDHRLSCSSRLWQQILAELHRRGQRRHESGAFLLGISHEKKCRVTAAIYYDELDPQAYSTGVCILHGGSFAKLWAICRDKNLTVVADAHTCLLYTSPSPRDRQKSRMPSSA